MHVLRPLLLEGLFLMKWSNRKLSFVHWSGILCYGVAILAMGGAAPRSLRRLGWAFLISGCIIFLGWMKYGPAISARLGINELGAGAMMMMMTFGLLHLAQGFGCSFAQGGKGSCFLKSILI